MKRHLLFNSLWIALSASSLMQAQPCSQTDITGSWVLIGDGAIVKPEGTPITGPFARVAVFTSDGNGNLEFNSAASYNGFPATHSFKGTYTVSPDCTVDYMLEVPLPTGEVIPGNFKGTIEDGKRQVSFMLVNPPGTTIHAVARKLENGGQCASR